MARLTLEELEKTPPGRPPSAVALVGEDGYLVAEAASRLFAAWEKEGAEIRPFDGSPAALADELRSGSLFGNGVVFVVEDPEWLVGDGGDGKRRASSLLRSIRDGKGDPARRLVEILVARGAAWDPDSPGAAREALAGWLADVEADGEARESFGRVLEGAIAARIEASSGGSALADLESALSGIADGNRLLLRLTSLPKKTSPGAVLLPKFDLVPIELPPGDVRTVLSRMAEVAAKEAGIRFAPGAAALLVERTAPPERPDSRDRNEPSIRLFRIELDKLLAAAGPGGVVDPPLVSQLVEDASSAVLWDIDGAIAERNAAAAVLLLRKLLSRKGSATEGEALMIQGYLAALFRRMVAIHDRLGARVREARDYGGWKRSSYPALADLLEKGKKDYPLFKATQTAGVYSPEEAERGLLRLAAIDRSAKTGGPPVSEQLEGFLAATLPRRTRPARPRGFSLIEVVVGFAILALVLTAGVTLFTWQVRRRDDQTLWRRALEAVEEEAETNRAVPAEAILPGTGKFLTMEGGGMPESMMLLKDPIATRTVQMVGEDPRLLSITLSLSWALPGRRVHYEEVLVVAKRF